MRKFQRWMAAIPVAALALAGTAAHALYKVVGPDGKVTYTDAPPPPNSGSKVSTVTAGGASIANDATLPLELRQASQRYPVTLYTMKDCGPCDAGRELLRRRGIPHTEKLIISGEDGDALQRLSGGRDAPTLTIGSQVLRGLTTDNWNSYLDAAGYPRESRLPATYQYPAASPLTQPARPAATTAPPAPEPASPQPVSPPAPGGIRF